jgi:hypothetical protein
MSVVKLSHNIDKEVSKEGSTEHSERCFGYRRVYKEKKGCARQSGQKLHRKAPSDKKPSRCMHRMSRIS